MAASALRKNREEVSTDLSAAGFDKKQSLAIVQAAADTVAAMDLATRADLSREVGRLEKKIDGVKAGVDNLRDGIGEIKVRLGVLEKDVEDIKQTLGRLPRLIFWSITGGFTAMAFLITVYGMFLTAAVL